MIPQADLDRALARWKSRQAGHEQPTPGPSDLAITIPGGAVPPEVLEASSAAINVAEFDDQS
jgi:hypothetical protein